MRIATLLFPALLLATPVCAEDFEESVRQNIGLAIGHCIQHLPDGVGLAKTMMRTGFNGPLVDDYGGGETLHRFYAPGDTAEVWIKDSTSGRASCLIASNHMNASQALALVDEFLAANYPGQFTAGEADGSRAVTVQKPKSGHFCTGYFGDVGNGTLTISVGADTIDPVCRDDDGNVAIHIKP